MKTINMEIAKSDGFFVREAFNTLRTNIQFCGKDIKTILITSCYANEGKTTISVELAKSLAEIDKKVLLLDMDLRKSVMMQKYTKETGLNGVSQMLSGIVEKDDAIVHTQIPGMDVLFSGLYPPNPTQLIESQAFSNFMKEAREDYDYVIVDAPPLGAVIDGAIIASQCDGAVMVVNAGHVSYRFAQTTKAQLSKSGCRILGVVLNQMDHKKEHHMDKYYKSHYGYGYGGKHSESYDHKEKTDASTAEQSQNQPIAK